MIEAAVGAACLAAGAGVWRRPGLRILAVVLVIAGVVAVAHAVTALV